MSIIEKYFINWYMKLAYFGNFTYSCFLVIWLIGITYELYRTLKKVKRLQYLDIEDSKSWNKHYNNRIFKLAIMLVIILFEGVQVALSLMDHLYTPTRFPIYGNETTPVRFNNAYSNILYCLSTNKFVPVGLVVYSIKITVFLYILWAYSLCLNYCSMAYTNVNHIEYRKLCKPTVKWVMLSSLVPFLMVSNYTVLTGVFSYFMLITTAAVRCVLSQKQLIRTLQAKRFDLNQESSKRQVRKIDKELWCVKNIGGIVICIGLVKIFSNFFCGSIGNVIIPIARNPCWISNSYHGAHTQVEAITIIIAQAVFSIGKLVNMSYVLIILALNVLVGCLYQYVRKIQLDRIVKKKYTTYGKSLTRGLLR